MQIEQLASMPKELPPRTTTTIFDAAAASPKIWSFRSLVMARWRSKGALILYVAFAMTLLGCKMFWPEPRQADASLPKTKAKATATATPTWTETGPATATKSQQTSGKSNVAKPADAKATPVASARKPAPAAAAAPTTAPVASAKAKRPRTATPDPLGPLYIDETNGFSVRFPAGWLIRTFEGDPWVIDVGDVRVGLISVGFAPFPEAFTTDSIPPDWIAKRIKRRADTTLHAQGYAMIGGRKALWSKATGPLPMTNASPRMTRVSYILPLGDGRVLELRVAAAPEQFDRLVPVMRKAVETFALQTPRRREREPMASAR
jgi:hypothetical protein